MRALIATAPDEIRSELRDLNVHRLLERASGYGSSHSVLRSFKSSSHTWMRDPDGSDFCLTDP